MDATIEARLSRLERSARRWRLAAVLAPMLLLLLAARDTPLKAIQAERLLIVDPEGKVRIGLGVTEKGNPSLYVFDRAGKRVVGLYTGPDGDGRLALDGPGGSSLTLGFRGDGAPVVLARGKDGADQAWPGP